MAVVIGKEYKNAFDSIRRLVEGGCAPEEVRLENGRIVHGREVFEYSDSAAGIDVRGGGANVSMEGGKGASWFASLRGDRRDNGLAKWKDLIETVSGYYHEHYSLTDRGAPLSGPDEETRRRTADALFSLVRLLLPAFGGYTEVRERRRKGGDLCDFYGLGVRAELSSGAGDSVPVLAKLYFRRGERALVPVSGGEAREIEDFVSSAPSGERGADFASDAAGAIADVFSAIDALLRDDRHTLADCLYFGRDRDREAVAELVKKLPSERGSLVCTGLRVLGISHVKLPDSVYDVLNGGVTALRATVSAGGRMTLTCVPCGVTLMESGRIYCTDKETGERRVIEPDLGEEDLGLSDADIEYIRANSAFGEHLMPNKCGNPKCRRRVCTRRMENIGGEKERLVCRDCPYPEVVFVSGEGKLMYTPDLAFARDEMTLVPKEDTQTCSCCSRTFTSGALTGAGMSRLCGFCRKALDEAYAGSREAKALYRRFSGMLGYRTRLKYFGKKKYCFDDDDITLFVLGGDVFTLDKTGVRADGFIDKPRRTY
ncbi:MAG TPA: hypothetical protein H9892_01090 [Candidatus Protoclostridium stercorigallinarum]|uniref:Uncharacterized protein n=1 Tax=Candidatus Protoclostridium stercorigallinarum TaxID=2838741 RepID=A0A9D1TQM6_9FIRM|nr:hypothetical protein [Candidatus Protoclostridium stercorigallinarum]